MGALRFRYLSHVRRSWRAWMRLALLCAIACSLPLAVWADARRAQSAITRAFAAQHGSDVVVNADISTIGAANAASYLAAIDAMPEVRASGRLGGVMLEEVTADGKIADALNIGSASAKLLDEAAIDKVGTFRLLHGRLPVDGRADEVVVNPEMLAVTGWNVGDTISTLRLFRTVDLDQNGEPDPTKGSPVRPLHIVGEVRRPEEFLDDASSRAPQIYLYPAFASAYPDAAFYTNDFIRLVGGRSATAGFRAKVQTLAATYENNEFFFVSIAEGIDRTQQALRPQIVAWLLLAAVSFGAAIVIVAQTIGRRLSVDNGDLSNLHALGMTRRELTLIGVVEATTIAFATVAIGVVLAVLSSFFTPLGTMHEVDPTARWLADPLVLFGGGTATLVLLVAISWLPARRAAIAATAAPTSERQDVHRRPSRVVAALARAGCPPTMVVGSGFALQAGRDRAAARVRGIFVTAALAVGVLVMAVAFSADLHHLVTTPRLYGWDWDVGVANDFGSIPDGAVTAIKARPEVAAAAGFTTGTVTIDGHSVAAVGIDQLQGSVFPTLDSGRLPHSDDEVVLGRLTLDDLHRSVGDTVTVETSNGKHTLRVVGLATFPELGPNRFSGTSLGRGAAMTVNVLPTTTDQFGGRYSGLFIRLDPHRDRTASIASLHAFVLPLGCGSGCFVTDLRPSQLQGYSDLGNIWLPFVVVLGLLFAISLAHGILWSAGIRNRDLRILTALGFGRWQIAATIAWQAFTIAIISLAAGTALGEISSNAGWHLFTDRFGIDTGTWSSALQLITIWATVLTGAVVAGLCAVPAATRMRQLR